MKKYFLLALFICTLGFSLVGQKTVVVTLSVDTENITPTTTDEHATFGQSEDVSNEDYTIDVDLGDTIVWRGVSSSDPDNDVVKIKSINFEGGVNLFDKNVLREKNNGSGVVTAVVSKGNNGDVEKYTVSFVVFNNGKKRFGTLLIDPRARCRRCRTSSGDDDRR